VRRSGAVPADFRGIPSRAHVFGAASNASGERIFRSKHFHQKCLSMLACCHVRPRGGLALQEGRTGWEFAREW
jgi:hypothetical protein